MRKFQPVLQRACLVAAVSLSLSGAARAQVLPQQPFAWGADSYQSELNLLSRVQFVSVGSTHALVLTNAGEVVQLGNTPVSDSPSGLTSPRWIAAGNKFSLAIDSTGKIVGWGAPNSNRGMNGIPRNVGGFIYVAAGTENGAAVREDGTFVVWGKNNFQEVTGVPNALTRVEHITIGTDFMVAIDPDGKLWAWGRNQQSNRLIVSNVPQGSDFVTANASPSGNHAVALRKDGTVVAWGLNDSGQCDVPTRLTHPSHPNFQRAKRAVAGDDHSAALLEDGTVVVWGSGRDGQLDAPAGMPTIGQLYAGGRMTVGLTPRARGMVTLDRQKMVGGSDASLTGSIRLDRPAAQDMVIRLKSNSPSLQVPARVTVSVGQSTVQFPVVHRPVNSETLVAVSASQDMRQDLGYIRLVPVSVQTIAAPRAVLVDSTAKATVSLSAPMTVDTRVTVGTGEGLTAPTSVVVPAGRTSAEVDFAALPNQGSSTSSLAASVHGGGRSATVRIVSRPTVSTFSVPTVVWGQQTVNGRLQLSHVSPADTEIELTSDRSELDLPSKIVVPAGVRTVTFPIGVSDPRQTVRATVRAKSENSEANVQTEVRANGVSSLRFETMVTLSGEKVKVPAAVVLQGTVSEDTLVTLEASVPGAVPATAVVPAGSRVANFQVVVDRQSATNVNVTATRVGRSVSRTLRL